MSKKCQLTGKTFQSGNNVSHAKNRTRRRFLPNLQNTSLFSEVLNKPVKFRVSSRAIRTVEKKGGIDKFLADAFEKDLSASALYYKKLIKRKETIKA